MFSRHAYITCDIKHSTLAKYSFFLRNELQPGCLKTSDIRCDDILSFHRNDRQHRISRRSVADTHLHRDNLWILIKMYKYWLITTQSEASQMHLSARKRPIIFVPPTFSCFWKSKSFHIKLPSIKQCISGNSKQRLLLKLNVFLSCLFCVSKALFGHFWMNLLKK